MQERLVVGGAGGVRPKQPVEEGCSLSRPVRQLGDERLSRPAPPASIESPKRPSDAPRARSGGKWPSPPLQAPGRTDAGQPAQQQSEVAGRRLRTFSWAHPHPPQPPGLVLVLHQLPAAALKTTTSVAANTPTVPVCAARFSGRLSRLTAANSADPAPAPRRNCPISSRATSVASLWLARPPLRPAPPRPAQPPSSASPAAGRLLHRHREDGARLQVDPVGLGGPSASDHPIFARSVSCGDCHSLFDVAGGQTAPTPLVSASQSPMPQLTHEGKIPRYPADKRSLPASSRLHQSAPANRSSTHVKTATVSSRVRDSVEGSLGHVQVQESPQAQRIRDPIPRSDDRPSKRR